MINTQIKEYRYCKYSTENNSYGQKTLLNNGEPIGTVKLAINTTTQSVQDSILYKDASYLALTWDKDIDDTYVILINDVEKAKVLYVSAPNKLRLKQVYLQKSK